MLFLNKKLQLIIKEERISELKEEISDSNTKVRNKIFNELLIKRKNNLLNKLSNVFSKEPHFVVRINYIKYYLKNGININAKYIEEILIFGNKKEKIDVLHLIDDFYNEISGCTELLMKSLHDTNKTEIIHTLRVIGKHGDNQFFDSIIKCLDNKLHTIRNEAIIALGKLDKKEALQEIIFAQFDKHVAVRKTARKILSDIGSIELKQKLLKSLIAFFKKEMDKNSFLKIEIINFIKSKKIEKAVSLLIEACEDKYKSVRLHAVKALAVFKDPLTISKLLSVAKDKYFDVRLAVVDALKQIPHDESLKGLKSLQSDSNFIVRKQAESAYYQLLEKMGKQE